MQELIYHQVVAKRALSEGNDVFIGTKTGSDKSLAYECLPGTRVAIGVSNSGCIQSNRPCLANMLRSVCYSDSHRVFLY